MEHVYETFIRKLKEALEEKGIEGAKIRFEEKGGRFSQAGDRLLVEFAEHGDAREVCALYTEELFAHHRAGTSVEELADEIMLDIEEVKNSGMYDRARNMADYESVKDFLFIRLLNADLNSEELKNAVYKTIGDIALVLYAKIGERDGCITSTKIHMDLVEEWGKDSEAVFREALLNTYFVSPPRIYRWEHMLSGDAYEGECFMDIMSEYRLRNDVGGNCLSTRTRTNGAVAVFLPGVAERLGQLLGSDFYIVFTSIHEVMIHDDTMVTPEQLEHILDDTLRCATPEEDYLSSYIYHYCRKNHRFTCLCEEDERNHR